MSRISRIKRCQCLPHNAKGRDLVVGDLHGHRSLLEQELERLRFDPARDRVFSVGDLIDRGPESLATLALIEEPWFHAVLGNHELALLNYLDFYSSRVHSRKSFPTGAGEWINQALDQEHALVQRLAHRLATLPLVIHVDDALPFNVVHGDLHPLNAKQEQLASDETVCVHKADAASSSRVHIGEALKSELLGLRFRQHSVQVSPTPVSEPALTYAGHSPVRHVTVHNSYVYIDQGVSRATKGEQRPPTVLEHRQFAYWLHGVNAARGQAVAA